MSTLLTGNREHREHCEQRRSGAGNLALESKLTANKHSGNREQPNRLFAISAWRVRGSSRADDRPHRAGTWSDQRHYPDVRDVRDVRGFQHITPAERTA